MSFKNKTLREHSAIILQRGFMSADTQYFIVVTYFNVYLHIVYLLQRIKTFINVYDS